MNQAPSTFSDAMSRAWNRLPLSARLALCVLAATAVILLSVAVDIRSQAPAAANAAAANAAVAAPAWRDLSMPDAGQALPLEEAQQDPPVPTF